MFHKIQVLPASIQKPISWNSFIYRWRGGGGGGATYLTWFTLPPTTPHPPPPPRTLQQWIFTDNKTSFQCFFSQNDENFFSWKHFLLVYNNQSLEIHWMIGGGQPIPASLSYPTSPSPLPSHTHTPMTFKQWLAIDFVMAVNGLTSINGQFLQKKDTAR